MATSSSGKITYFAETDFRGKRTRFGIKDEDRGRHVYVIGKTGMGKSTMLENMAIQDIQNGNGIAFIDPHGSTAEKLLDYIPEDRIKDLIYFAPFDLDYPVSFNVMEDVGKDERHLVANGLMSAFKKIWVDAWSARMEYILTNVILALLEYPGATLLGVNRMLADKNYRKKVVDNITDPSVKTFWVEEYGKYTDRYISEAIPPIQNKVGQFTSNPLLRNIIGQPQSSFNFRQVMDNKKILIINLSKGRMGEINAALIGSMIITKIYLAAMSRANLPSAQLKQVPPFYLFVDEFQSFANESFANILSEARKYKLSLTLAHQYIEQMSEEVRAAVFGNVGTTMAFRVGPFDAEVLEKIFLPTFTQEDIVNLGFAQVYLTLMIDGVGSAPFSAKTLGPWPEPARSFKSEAIASSRILYAHDRLKVENEIQAWLAEGRVEERAPVPPPRPKASPPPHQQPPRPQAATPAPKPQPAAVPKVQPPPAPAPVSQAVKEPELPPEKVNQLKLEPKPFSLKSLQTAPDKSKGKHTAELRQLLSEVQKDLQQALPSKNQEQSKTAPAPAPKPVVEKEKEKIVEKRGVPDAELRKMLEL
jgi:hypothetical protein